MKKILAITLLSLATTAYAAEPAKKPHELTVLEAVNAGNALRQLGPYPEIVDGKQTGKMVSVPFEFSGSTLMNFATNIASADQAQRNYQKVYQDLFNKYAAVVKDKDGKDTATRQVPLDKISEFNEVTNKAMDAPSGQLWVHLKPADLCLNAMPDGKPVAPCTAVNHIPPAVLAGLIPLVDR